MLPQKNSIRFGVVLVGVGVLALLLLVILSPADKKAGGLYAGVNSALSQNAADGTDWVLVLETEKGKP